MNRNQKTVTVLTLVLCAAVVITALIALVYEDGGNTYKTVSLRSEEVEIYGGSGMYQYDTVRKALMQRAYDLYYLTIGIPILIIGLFLYLKRGVIGFIILISSLMFYFYSFLISSIGLAYNAFFLIYMAVFVLSIFAIVYVLKGISMAYIQDQVINRLPVKTIAVFNLILVFYFIVSWLIVDFTTLLTRSVHPDLDIYTTAEQNITDLSVYATSSTIAAVLLLKKKPIGAILSLGITFMAMQTFVALSIFTCLDVAFHQKDLSNIEFPMVIFFFVSLIVAIKAVFKLKGIHLTFSHVNEYS